MSRAERLIALVLRPTSPPLSVGIVLAGVLIAAEIAIVLALKQIAPDNAFGAIFLFGVLVISAGWGMYLALATSLASAIAYVTIHVSEGSESFAPSALVFLTLALLTNLLVGQSRVRALEARQRSAESELAAALARSMLRAATTDEALDAAGRLLSRVLDVPAPHAVLTGPDHIPEPDPLPDSGICTSIPLHDGDILVGYLLVPIGLSADRLRRIRRMVPSLEALLSAVWERDRLTAELDESQRRSHARITTLARRQSALRRVATLVARRAEPDPTFAALLRELTTSADARHISVIRYDGDQFAVLAAHDEGAAGVRPGDRLPLGGHNIASHIASTGTTATLSYADGDDPVSRRAREHGLIAAAGAPIVVDDDVWGAVIVATAHGRIDDDIVDHIADFADLAATAVVNDEIRTQLTRSRARVIAATDAARRALERDLHDGAQQRIVSLGLELRAIQANVPAGAEEVRGEIDRAVDMLSQIHGDLQELSRGIHPAILSRGGLAAALKTLARRSPIPVETTISVPRRLPEPVEVAAYYVVAEALTNTAKYAGAEVARVTATATDEVLLLEVTDDGIGGALPETGSGLIGLHDRIDSAGGTIDVISPPGGGTRISVRVPLPVDR
ncbi:GAF domain-containing protein [Gordonia sp. NB41Y]|uniref:GAF domain-containing protein n=1 Tax=Gordonia sp. NB41Y TaxID=875808 RepID=UPI0009EAD01D|nr:GAF domain-containing protein [Gordonia sp. NB41Y]WLP88747.1 histidine kinase [Gordonia sp. NB41Y]